MAETRSAAGGRLFFGLALTLLGVLLTLNNFDVLDAAPILRLYPVLIILLGLAKMSGFGMPRHRGFGLVLVVVGTWLLLDTLDIAEDVWDFWPLLLVALGGCLVFRALGRRDVAGAEPGPAGGTGSGFSIFAFLSGVERQNSSPEFRGGEATAVMGGCEIDLRSARMQCGQAVVDTFALWGGVELRVPRDWRVSGEVTPILGAFEDKTAPPAGEAQGHLIVKGTAIMGGIEVSN